MSKILIADDQSIMLDGLEALLTRDIGIEVVATAQNGEEVLELLRQHPDIDVAVLDIEMPKLNGIETTKRIKQSHEGVSVLILSMYKQIQYILASQKAGADGYLLKDTNKDELVYAIHEIAKGNIYFGQEVMATELRYKRARVQMPRLTQKEQEVLKLIVKGMTAQEVGENLNIASSTVETHRKHLKTKFQARNNVDLVRYALQYGYVNLSDDNDQIEPMHHSESLTKTEQIIYDLIQEGKTSNQIAKQLNKARGTIDTHRKNINKKLG